MGKVIKFLLLCMLVVALLSTSASALLVENITTGETLFYDDFERVSDPVNGTQMENAWPGTWTNFTPGSPGENYFKVFADGSAPEGNNWAASKRLGSDGFTSYAHLSSLQSTTADTIRITVDIRSKSPQPGDWGFQFHLKDSSDVSIFTLTVNDDGDTT